MRFNYSILGGTFDHLHNGHKYFIKTALDRSEKITIGIATDSFTKNKLFPASLENYKTREKSLRNFINNNGYTTRVQIIPINDIYGTSLKDPNIGALFVTTHGLPNAKIINQKRTKIKFPKLIINKVSYLRGDYGRVISSTRIRKGEIDRRGSVFEKIFQNNELVLLENLRAKTKNTPQGKLVKTLGELEGIVRNSRFIIAVGDVVSSNLVKFGRQADVSIIDYKVGRKSVRNELESTSEAKNDPGTVNPKAVGVLKKAIEQALRGNKEIIKVSGEEDLLALPATLLAPLDSLIIYGMPASGAIIVEITEEKKAEVLNLLKKFKKVNK